MDAQLRRQPGVQSIPGLSAAKQDRRLHRHDLAQRRHLYCLQRHFQREDIYFLRLPDLPLQITIAQAGTNAALSWNAVVGNTYCLQYKSSLTAPWPIGSNQICLVATNSLMTVTDTILGGAAQRFYRVVVTGYAPGGPTITRQPASLTNYVSLTATLSVSAFGAPPLSYQWRNGSGEIPGATQNSLTLTPLALSDAGTYHRSNHQWVWHS